MDSTDATHNAGLLTSPTTLLRRRLLGVSAGGVALLRGKVAVYADVAMQLPPTVLPQFIKAHSLPAEFSITAQRHYLPLADWLSRRARQTAPFVLGINGAQGTGKSTLAQFLKAALHEAGQRAAVLSIDDFYLDKLSREALATEVHPLLRVRGVPGTHDTVLMRQTLKGLRSLQVGETLPQLSITGP